MTSRALILLMHQRLVKREMRRTKDPKKLAELEVECKSLGRMIRQVRRDNKLESK